MPCSQCNSPDHNRRNASCPVNIANRNGTRPPAELQPRPRFVEPAPQITIQRVLEEYLLLYRNMRPIQQYETEDGVIYNVYKLLQNAERIPERIFVRCNLVTARRVRGVLTSLAVRNNHSEITFLRDVPFPQDSHAQLYIFIPQIPGFNVTHLENNAVIDAREITEANMHKVRQYINGIHISMNPAAANTDGLAKTEMCSICLDDIDMSKFIQLRCEHKYCVLCIQKSIQTYKKNYSNRSDSSKVMSCALCRTQITTFAFSDTEERRAMIEYIDREICEHS
jgi:hypothetical protein